MINMELITFLYIGELFAMVSIANYLFWIGKELRDLNIGLGFKKKQPKNQSELDKLI